VQSERTRRRRIAGPAAGDRAGRVRLEVRAAVAGLGSQPVVRVDVPVADAGIVEVVEFQTLRAGRVEAGLEVEQVTQVDIQILVGVVMVARRTRRPGECTAGVVVQPRNRPIGGL